jgi:hypothetical protein
MNLIIRDSKEKPMRKTTAMALLGLLASIVLPATPAFAHRGWNGSGKPVKLSGRIAYL